MTQNNYKLFMAGMPIVRSLDDLSNVTHLSKGLLYQLWKFNNFYYKAFQLPKKSGGMRDIACPAPKIKAVQSWVLKNILEKIDISPYATAYRKGVSLVANIRPHYENRYFLCMDLEDFFPSIQINKVFNVFKTVGYSDHVSHILASLCTYKAGLPQGGVTSPALSNIICIKFDRRLASYTGKRNISYSRYADDMTFSGSNPNLFRGLSFMVEKIAREEGFSINHKKTRFLGPCQRRRITGITISEHGVGIGRLEKRKVRAAIYQSFNAAQSQEVRDTAAKFSKGWLSFMRSVDSKGHAQLNNFLRKMEMDNL